jgi:hypothetical protein
MKRAGVATLLLLTGFAVGAWVAAYRGWGSSGATTFIENKAAEPLRTVTVILNSCNEQRTFITGKLAPGETRRVQYPVCGEGGYTIQAETDGGRVIKSEQRYVESGYVTSDQITDERIVSTYTSIY